jgi:hypothetical protein
VYQACIQICSRVAGARRWTTPRGSPGARITHPGNVAQAAEGVSPSPARPVLRRPRESRRLALGMFLTPRRSFDTVFWSTLSASATFACGQLVPPEVQAGSLARPSDQTGAGLTA